MKDYHKKKREAAKLTEEGQEKEKQKEQSKLETKERKKKYLKEYMREYYHAKPEHKIIREKTLQGKYHEDPEFREKAINAAKERYYRKVENQAFEKMENDAFEKLEKAEALAKLEKN